MNRKILIVGNAGYVGGYLTSRLVNSADSSDEIYGYDSLLYETRYLKFLGKQQFHFINGDIRDRQKLKGCIDMCKPDWIVWLAGVVGDGACKNQTALAKEINEDSVKWLVQNYDGAICFPSTCSVYGKNDNLLDENSPANPLSIYAETKYAAEQYLLNNHAKSVIFRLGTLHSVSDEHSRIRLDLVVNIMTLKAFTGQPIQVFGQDQWRPMADVKDVGNAMMYFMDSIGYGTNNYGLYNLAESNSTILGLAKKVQSQIPCEIKINDIPFQDERNYKVNTFKILTTGWKPSYTVEDGIAMLKKVFESQRLCNVADPVYYNEQYTKDKVF